MPLFATSQTFLDQANLLISARPSTTRVTAKYNVPPPPKQSPLSKEPSATSQPPTGKDKARRRQLRRLNAAKKQVPPTLTIKCYDPVSGTCLKYQTEKAAEVGRLISALEGCGRVMAGMKSSADVLGDIASGNASKSEAETTAPAAETPAAGAEQKEMAIRGGKPGASSQTPQQAGQAQGQAGAGGSDAKKKKKKGKR